jgi:hypothetical protein
VMASEFIDQRVRICTQCARQSVVAMSARADQ